MNAAEPGRSGVIAGGNWIVDRVKIIDSWPPEDSLVNIRSEFHGNGGAPYDLLRNLSKLGAESLLEADGLIGKDPNGDFIIDDCKKHGIGTGQLRRTSIGATSYTGVMTIQATGRGSNPRCRHGHLGKGSVCRRTD